MALLVQTEMPIPAFRRVFVLLCYIDRPSKFREWNFGSSSSHSGIETAGDNEARPLARLLDERA